MDCNASNTKIQSVYLPKPWMRRAQLQQRKKTKKKPHSGKKYMEKLFFPTSETHQKNLRRCLARSKIIGHSQKKTRTQEPQRQRS